MKKAFLIFVWVSLLFGFDHNATKNIEAIFSDPKRRFDILTQAIIDNRLDILEYAIQNELVATPNQKGVTLLDIAAYTLNKEAVKLLIPYIDPNHLTNGNLNSLREVLSGVLEKKKTTDKQDVFEIIDILKKNGARFDINGAYPDDWYFFGKKSIKKEPFLYALIEKILDDKSRFLFYVGLEEFTKAKSFLDNHIEILKEPYFLGQKEHIFSVFIHYKKYCDITKYIVNKGFENHIYVLDYSITGASEESFYEKYQKIRDDLKEKCFEKIFAQRTKLPFKSYEIFRYIKENNYKMIKEVTKYPGWNKTLFAWNIPSEYRPKYYEPMVGMNISPFAYVVFVKRDKKMIDIMLKNGGYISGWNELHYKLLQNKPLQLKKYKKWERVFKLNQGDIINNVTPLYLAFLYGDFELVKQLVQNGARVDVEIFKRYGVVESALEHKVDKKISKFLLLKRKYINEYDIKLLARLRDFELLEFIKKHNLHSKNKTLQSIVKTAYKEMKKYNATHKKDKYTQEEFAILKKLFDLEMK